MSERHPLHDEIVETMVADYLSAFDTTGLTPPDLATVTAILDKQTPAGTPDAIHDIVVLCSDRIFGSEDHYAE